MSKLMPAGSNSNELSSGKSSTCIVSIRRSSLSVHQLDTQVLKMVSGRLAIGAQGIWAKERESNDPALDASAIVRNPCRKADVSQNNHCRHKIRLVGAIPIKAALWRSYFTSAIL